MSEPLLNDENPQLVIVVKPLKATPVIDSTAYNIDDLRAAMGRAKTRYGKNAVVLGGGASDDPPPPHPPEWLAWPVLKENPPTGG